MRLSLAQLSDKTGVPERTIRFYIDRGLVPSAHGTRRGAWYNSAHLEPLLKIQAWRAGGLSLDAISELLLRNASTDEPKTRPGTVEVRTHLTVADGVELVIAPERAGLGSHDIRHLYRVIHDTLKTLGAGQTPQEDNDP